MEKPKLQTVCAKIKLRPNCEERLAEWIRELNSRSNEVFATLVEEGVYLESVFLDKTSDSDYLIYVMRLEDTKRANDVVQKSIHKIDQYHNQFNKDCWETNKKLELLLDFDRHQDYFK